MFVRFLLLCRTDVCRCAEVVLIASVVFAEYDPVFIQALIMFFHLLYFAIYCRLDELPCDWPDDCAFQVYFIQLLVEFFFFFAY